MTVIEWMNDFFKNTSPYAPQYERMFEVVVWRRGPQTRRHQNLFFISGKSLYYDYHKGKNYDYSTNRYVVKL